MKTGRPLRSASSTAAALHLVDRRDLGATEQGRQLGRVHLEADARPALQPAPGIGEDRQFGPRLGHSPERIEQAPGDHAGFGRVDLFEHDDGVDFAGRPRGGSAISWASIAAGVGVQFFESSRFSSTGGLPGSTTSGLQ